MELFIYFFSATLAFLGLLLGGLFSSAIQKELHSFKHFLPFMQLLVLVATFLLLFLSFPFFIVFVLFLFTFTFIWVFWHKKDHNVIDYIVFALILVLTSLQPVVHFYMTLILFFFGFFAGGLFYSLHVKPQPKTNKNKVTNKTKTSRKTTKTTIHDDYHPHVAHHRHSGQHHEHHIIMKRILAKYFFFLPLTLLAFIIAELITLFF